MNDNIHTLNQMLDNAAIRFMKKTALIFGAKKVSYGQLSSRSAKLASALYNLGVREFDKVALWLPNCPEFIYSFFSILKLRAIVVPVNTMFKREEAKFVIEDSQARVLICSVDKAFDSENILSRINTLSHLICLSELPGRKSVLDFNRLINTHPEFSNTLRVKSEDIAEIVYTSGTTGKPKGACLSHRNILTNIKDCARVIHFSKRDCLICILPLFHSFSSTVCMCLPLYKGAKIIIMRAVRPFKRVIRTIFKYRVTIFVGVPSIYNIISEVKLSRRRSLLNSLFNPVRIYISGAADLPLAVWHKFKAKFKRPLLQGYGLTEASPVVSLNPLGRDDKPNSVGLALPSLKVKVVDHNNREVASGMVGELLVKGDSVMAGYHNLPEETKNVLRQGWLHTGDLAKIDEQGFIYIMGRLKEMINVRGFNVYPREIEDILYKHPKVKEAAVVGVFHRHRGEVPIAFVVGEQGIKEREVLEYLRANIASYKVPLKLVLKDSLVKNSTGKILKRKLKEEIEDIFL